VSIDTVLLLLAFRQVLEHFSSKGEWNRVGQVDEKRVVHGLSQLFVAQLIVFHEHVFLYNPEVLSVDLKSYVSIIKSVDGLFYVFKEFRAEYAHSVRVLENSVRYIIQYPLSVSNFLEWNEREGHLSRVSTFELIIINDHQSLADDEAEQVQVLLVFLDHL
jgi:hypothetical protein